MSEALFTLARVTLPFDNVKFRLPDRARDDSFFAGAQSPRDTSGVAAGCALLVSSKSSLDVRKVFREVVDSRARC